MKKVFKIPEDVFLTKELLAYFIEECGGASAIAKIVVTASGLNGLRKWSGKEIITSEQSLGEYLYKGVQIPICCTPELPEHTVEIECLELSSICMEVKE